ncbi:CDP-archaeol synthase [archaeon]|nr:CDP-archaeol synthase [archaeon]
MNILLQIISVFWLFLPAGIANMTIFLSRNINILNKPVNKKLIGEHKTYKGFVVGVGIAIIAVYLQAIISNYINSEYLIIDYQAVNLLLVGFLLGSGAVLGDLTKSLFKRRKGISPGHSWPPWDEIDFSIGAVLFLSLYIIIDYYLMILAVIVFGIISLAGSYIGYLFGLRKKSEIL